jgi:hypothetical protein
VIGRYALGVAAALGAGAAYNTGQLAQKIAVNRLSPPEGAGGGARSPLFVRLLRSPVWLSGFAVVLFLGTPLNVVAALWLGPAILPGLMSLGLVVLAVGAVKLAGEKLGAADIAGIALVMAGLALVGLSRLRIDVAGAGIQEPALLRRLAIFTLCTTALAAAAWTRGARGHPRLEPARHRRHAARLPGRQREPDRADPDGPPADRADPRLPGRLPGFGALGLVLPGRGGGCSAHPRGRRAARRPAGSGPFLSTGVPDHGWTRGTLRGMLNAFSCRRNA